MLSAIQSIQKSTIERATRISLSTFILLLPALAIFSLVQIHSGYQLQDYHPNWTDEKYYWHQILTFKEYGFDGGYYTTLEIPSKLAFSRYYTKGPVFPAIYGIFSRFTGWQENSGVLLNLIFVSFSLAIFLYTTRPDTKQLLLIAGAIISFWPLLLFLDRINQEPIMNAVAILSAALFYIVLIRHGNLALPTKAVFVVFLFFTALIRGGTWSALLFPLFVISAPDKRLHRLIIDTAAGAAAVAMSFWSFAQVLSPTSNFGSSLPTSRIGLQNTVEKIGANLWNFNRGLPIWILQRYQITFLSIAALGSIGKAVWKHKNPLNHILVDQDRWFWEAVFHLINLGGILLANTILYDMFDWRDYRILGPHLLLSLFLLIAFKRYWLAIVIIIANLAFIGPALNAWDELSRNSYIYSQEDITEFRQQLSPHIIFDPKAESGWCNTLLLSNVNLVFDVDFTAVPAGIGVSHTGTEFARLNLPPKSKYVFMTDEEYEIYRDQLSFRLLAETKIGSLYLNLDANCT